MNKSPITCSKAILGLAFVLLPLACNTTPKEPEPTWQTAEVPSPSDRVLWKVTLLSLDKMGFPLSSGLDPSSMKLETGWKLELAPFSKEGRRRKAVVNMTPMGRGKWDIQARIKCQMNKSLVKPLDPRYADWEWIADDVVAARILVQHVRSFLQEDIELTETPSDPIEAYLERQKAREAKKPR